MGTCQLPTGCAVRLPSSMARPERAPGSGSPRAMAALLLDDVAVGFDGKADHFVLVVGVGEVVAVGVVNG